MDAIRIPNQPSPISWEYDKKADVLYLSLGEPRPATSIDIGDAVILRYDEAAREIVGLTVIGLRERLLQQLGGE